VGAWLYRGLMVDSLPLCLGPCGHSVARDGPQPGDVAYSNLRVDERASYQVSTIGLGAVPRGWVCTVVIHPKQRNSGADIVHKPPHRIRDTRCECVRRPHLECTEMVKGRTKVNCWDAMIGPRSAMIGGVPCEDFRANRCDRMLLKIEGAAMKTLIRGYGRVVFKRS
jgi:hypothetical protein